MKSYITKMHGQQHIKKEMRKVPDFRKESHQRHIAEQDGENIRNC